MTMSDPRRPARWRPGMAASSRTGVVACMQEGAPGQAAMRRRGSSGSRMKLSPVNAADRRAGGSTDGTGTRIARHGVSRRSCAPIAAAADASSAKSSAVIRPKGRPTPRNPAAPKRCAPRKAVRCNGACGRSASNGQVRPPARSFRAERRRPDRASGECVGSFRRRRNDAGECGGDVGDRCRDGTGRGSLRGAGKMDPEGRPIARSAGHEPDIRRDVVKTEQSAIIDGEAEFAGRACSEASLARRCSRPSAIGRTSSTAAGSSPASGLEMTLRMASPASLSSSSPASASASCRSGRCCAESPRNCRLARLDRSI